MTAASPLPGSVTRRSLLALAAGAAIAAAMSLGAAVVYAKSPPPIARGPASAGVAIDRVTPLAAGAGEAYVLSGVVATAFDGARFDAAALFDFAAGGLRVVGHNDAAAVVKLEALAGEGAGCVASGVSSPCLVPHIVELAHARLLSVEELEQTLSGHAELQLVAPPAVAPIPWSASLFHILSRAAVAALAVGLLGASVVAARRVLRSPLREVSRAAREARTLTRDDPTLAPVRGEIDRLVDRARELDRARKACAGKLARIDHGALRAREARWATADGPEATEARRWIGAERAEAEATWRDHGVAVAGLEQIAGALRVISLSAREHRGLRVRVGKDDPLAAVRHELHFRDRAIEEARNT